MEPLTQISILIVLILLSGFFSASETSLTSLSPSKVKELLSKKRKGSKKLEKIKQDPHRLLIAILIGNNIVNIGASAYAGLIFTELFGDAGIGIATAVMTFFILIFGEIAPKSVAYKHAAGMSLKIAWFYYWLIILLSPLIWFFDFIVKIFLKLFGEDSQLNGVTEEEIKAMVQLGAEEGSINKQEREFIENVLEFNDIIVEDVMIHRVDIEAMPESFSLAEASDYAISHSHSRLPVYGDGLDDIKGIISIKEILHALENHDETKKLSALQLAEPLIVPLTRKINSLFREFQRKRIHIAIVVDEHGGTAGLVTLEDLLEEIVGEILDESDQEAALVEKINSKTVIARGEAKMDDIHESIGVKLHNNMLENISTVLLEKLNRFPKEAELIEFAEASVEVLRMTGKKISSVKITKKSKKKRSKK